MGVFRFIFSPYIRAGRDLRRSAQNIRALTAQIKNTAAGEGGAAVLIDAPDSQAAFEALFIHNKWTPERLIAQRRAVRRAKWTALCLFWIGFCVALAMAIFLHERYVLLFGMGFACFFTFFMGVQILRYALYQAQIDLRTLLTFKEFLGRADIFKRILS